MCEGMLGGMCAGVVCEVILFCTRSVLRSNNIVRLMDGEMECPGRSVRVYVEEFVFGTCSRSNIVIAVSSNTIQ